MVQHGWPAKLDKTSRISYRVDEAFTPGFNTVRDAIIAQRAASRRALFTEGACGDQDRLEVAGAKQIEGAFALQPMVAGEEEPRLRPRVVLAEGLQDLYEARENGAGVGKLPRRVEEPSLRNLNREECPAWRCLSTACRVMPRRSAMLTTESAPPSAWSSSVSRSRLETGPSQADPRWGASVRETFEQDVEHVGALETQLLSREVGRNVHDDTHEVSLGRRLEGNCHHTDSPRGQATSSTERAPWPSGLI